MMAKFYENCEEVEAFQFVKPCQVADIVKAFGADKKKWRLDRVGGKLTVHIAKKKRKKPAAVPNAATLALSVVFPPSASNSPEGFFKSVKEGEWVVKRWVGTGHDKTVSMSDREFKRKYS